MTHQKTRPELGGVRPVAACLPERVLAAYHGAGHLVAARVLGRGFPGTTVRLQAENRSHCPGIDLPGPVTNTCLEEWLNFAAAGHAAERELANQSGMRWRGLVSNAGHDVEYCYRLIYQDTGEDHRDWILLHWTRAVTRVTRLLTENWGEVVRLAELDGGRGAVTRPRSSVALPLRADPSGKRSWSGWWDDAIRRAR
jgi:hypothetical protein